MNDVTKSLEASLELNLKLQRDLLSKLKHISKMKQTLLITLDKLHSKNTTTNEYQPQPHLDEEIRACTNSNDGNDRNIQSDNNDTNLRTTSATTQTTTQTTTHSKKTKTTTKATKTTTKTKTTSRKRPHPTKYAKGWEFNQNRKWTRRFFLDPNHSTPEPNTDTILRRQWEGELIGKGSYRFNPWSKQELDLLKECAEVIRGQQEEQQQQQQQQVSNDDEQVSNDDQEEKNKKQVKDVDIDFHKVTDMIEQRLSQTKLIPKQIRKIQSNSYSSKDNTPEDETIKLRLWTDYRTKFLTTVSPSINKSQMTKQETSKILQIMNQHNGNPPWDLVANALNNARTPFQCFRHAQIKMNNNIGTLNEHEDELLLKYVAASGPQYILNHHTSTFLSQRFFPFLSTRQVLIRVNTSLVNPNYRNERWSDKEERMLVLGMKTYCDDDYSISRVSALLPHRSSKLIMDKWNRSLNPVYSTQPFTKTEDKRLLLAVKETNVTSGDWKVISAMFPCRNSRTLLSRYIELTKRDDSNILKRRARQGNNNDDDGGGAVDDYDVNDNRHGRTKESHNDTIGTML